MRTFYYLILFTSSALAATHPSQNNKAPHPYDFALSSQRPRRLQGPVEHKRVSFPNFMGSRNDGRKTHSKKSGVPPYAVQMEPLVQYSQPDPLYSIEKQYISEAKLPESTDNDLIKKSFSTSAENDAKASESISRVGTVTQARLRAPPRRSPPPLLIHQPLQQQIVAHHIPAQVQYAAPYGQYYEEQVQGYEEPEPIIEIIIKESNISLPAPPPLPTPPPQKKQKEPVQVFYVKYKKDPYGNGDKVIYDAPEPAVTPPSNNPELEEPPYAHEPVEAIHHEEVTAHPPPSTTLKAIIRPDSEQFHATGVHITFGETQESHPHGPYKRGDLEQQSAPEPAIALPTSTHSSKPQISRSSTSGSTSQLTKRNPAPFNPQPTQFQPGFQQAASTFQQTPEYPPQDFQPPPLNQVNPPYSTFPQNFQFQKSQQQFTFNQQQQNQPPQRYHTINNPPPPTARPLQQQQPKLEQNQQQYHTINQPPLNLPPSNFRPFPQPTQPPPPFQQRQPQRPNQQDQHQHHVEQVNRLQQQQQHLQQHIIQQQQFNPNHFPQQQQQFNRPQQQQQQPQQHQQVSFRPQHPPQLQYPVDVVKAVENPHIQNHRVEASVTFPPPTRASASSTFAQFYKTTSTTTETTTPEIVTEDPRKIAEDKRKKAEKQKLNIANLPSEVPDDLREQLLSSGILSNADIQILDYDKIGDIPIENLPPEALANFQQVAGSERREQVVLRSEAEEEDSASSSSDQRTVTIKTGSKDGDMEMKVVRFGPGEDGSVADRYVRKDATQLAPVVLNDSKYNRYLPLQVAGAQFPVPEELHGRNVTSVVVLAPVDYEFLTRHDEDRNSEQEESRVGRSAAPVLEVQGVHFVAGDVLKTLVRRPTKENYRRWLQKENSTSAEKQSVVLLVVEPSKTQPEKEIFMYDISSGRVSKLRGELSSTFVQVAESNSNNQDLEEISDSAAGPGGDFTVKEASQVLTRSSS